MRMRRRGFVAGLIAWLLFGGSRTTSITQASQTTPGLTIPKVDGIAVVTVSPIYAGADCIGWKRVGTLTTTEYPDGRKTIVYRPLEAHSDIEVRIHGQPRPARLMNVTIKE